VIACLGVMEIGKVKAARAARCAIALNRQYSRTFFKYLNETLRMLGCDACSLGPSLSPHTTR